MALLPPIHLHVKTLRPKEVDIVWDAPIQKRLKYQRLGYNVRVYKNEYKENAFIQDWSVSTHTWKLSNLEPKCYYEIHVYSLLKNNETWEKSEQPSILWIRTAPRQKHQKKLLPHPPEAAVQVSFEDQRLRDMRKQARNEIIVWKSPQIFRGTISYKILWNNDLLGVTDSTFVDLGPNTLVSKRFKYILNAQYSHDSYDNYDSYDESKEEELKEEKEEPMNITIKLKSQTYYKGKTCESNEKCEVKLSNLCETNAHIKWSDIYSHDYEREQIVIWLYLEAKSNDKWQVQPHENEDQNIELIGINNIFNNHNGNESLFVAVWKKPFSRHLNNFFNIGTKHNGNNENDNANDTVFDDSDCNPKRDVTMNAFYIKAKQRAIVIEYCRKSSGFFTNMFGDESNKRRERLFEAMLHTILQRMNDDTQKEYGLFTFHDCNASIQWVFECEWVANDDTKKESLQKVLFDVFSNALKRMLDDHEWDMSEYNDKAIKKLLLLFFWLFKLFPNRFRSYWLIHCFQKLIRYTAQVKDMTVFEYLNHTYGKQLIWMSASNCVMKFLAMHVLKNKKTLNIEAFLASLLWYNVCWNCALIETSENRQKNHKILLKLHDRDLNSLKERFVNISDKLKTDKTVFDKILHLNDMCDYQNNKCCINFRNTYFKTMDSFLPYLGDSFGNQSIDSFAKLLHLCSRNIMDLNNRDFEKWRRYLRYIYKIVKELTQQEQKLLIINNAIKPIYAVIVAICTAEEAQGLHHLISELPNEYNKIDICMQVLLNSESYLLRKHGDKFVDLVCKVILFRKNNNEMEQSITIGDRVFRAYNKFAEYHLQETVKYWIQTFNLKYAINIMNKYHIPWPILSNALSAIVSTETENKYAQTNKDRNEKSMKKFEALSSFVIDYSIPLKGRKSIVRTMQSFWKETENVQRQNKFVNKLMLILFQLLFGKNTELELFDEITKQFRNKHNNLICSTFLDIPAIVCRNVMEQECFYRFNKTLSDKTNPFAQALLTKASGVYYLVGILMTRLNQSSKSEMFVGECLRLYKNNDALAAFFRADLGLISYYNNKRDKAIEHIKNAISLTTNEGYINLVNSIINSQEKSINSVINYLENIQINYSFFGRFAYCRWLRKYNQFDKAIQQFDIILKQQTEEKNMVMNGLIYYEYGQLLLDHKQKEKAKIQFQNAVNTNYPCLPNIHRMCNDKLKELDQNYHSQNEFENESKNNEFSDDDSAEIDSQNEEIHTQSAQQSIPLTGQDGNIRTGHL